MIPVTKSFLPPIEEYQTLIQKLWKSGWLTNRGVMVKELEQRINAYLGTKHMIAMTNGTLPLQIAIKALNLQGEIITTPFSYVATTSSIVWEGCTPVFVDIDPEYLTIDETKIEAAITKKTTAILATHVYGNPCNVDAIESIAKKYDLKVIYDAAHCFGVQYKGQSIFNYGDVSTCSFHATKVFHTGEGGAAFCNDEALYKDMYYHHNFGHSGPESFYNVGINAKMSELQAAMGLSVLPYMNRIIEQRRIIVDNYDKLIDGKVKFAFNKRKGLEWNYAYYPILFDSEEILLKSMKQLNEIGVFPRRYFNPSLNQLPYVKAVKCEISETLTKLVLCLPLYPELDGNIQKNIVNNL